jgi:protein-S-isoprenylcysteine O-methyltransferase Ste14
LFLKNLVFTLIAPATVGVYLPLWIARRASAVGGPIASVAQGFGYLLIVLGAAGYVWCVWEFATTGGGTPAPIDAPKRLVARGPYRYVRNPMYVSVLLTIIGWSLVFRLPSLVLYAAGLAVVSHLFVVFYEEPTLRRQFGVSYEQYIRQVRRWVPGRANRSSA